jgi:uncharacterized protein YwqG
MDKAAVLVTLTNAGLGRIAPDLEQLIRPSIRLTAHQADETAMPAGVSKLGGSPDLPAGVAWPIGKGAPLGFVAQIRLDDVHGLDAAQGLPATGLLSFFYDAKQETFGADPSDRGGWQVMLSPAGARLQRLSPPPQVVAEATYHACALSFAEEWTLPQQPELEQPTLSWTPTEKSAYESLLGRFPSTADRALPHHRMFGYADVIQDDMRLQCALASHGVSSLDDPRAAQLAPTAASWQLLLQVDSDPAASMRWASSGMLYFWIEAQALQERRFDDVWTVLQSE